MWGWQVTEGPSKLFRLSPRLVECHWRKHIWARVDFEQIWCKYKLSALHRQLNIIWKSASICSFMKCCLFFLLNVVKSLTPHLGLICNQTPVNLKTWHKGGRTSAILTFRIAKCTCYYLRCEAKQKLEDSEELSTAKHPCGEFWGTLRCSHQLMKT